MTDLEEAISRLTAWVRDYGDSKPAAFVGDVSILLQVAKESIGMTKQRSSLQKPLEDVLLSDKFLERFAAAFVDAAFPGTVTSLPPEYIDTSQIIDTSELQQYIGPEAVAEGIAEKFEDGGSPRTD